MMKTRLLLCLLPLLWMAFAASGQDSPEPGSPDGRYGALVREFQQLAHDHFKDPLAADSGKGASRVAEITLECIQLVEEQPDAPFALEALTQVVTQEYWLDNYSAHAGWGGKSPQARAIALLLRDHLENAALAETCKRVHFGFREECGTFLRAVLEKNPHHAMQGLACLRLAQFLRGRQEKLELLKGRQALSERYDQLFGKDYMATLKAKPGGDVTREVESLYERAITEFAGVDVPSGTSVGETAGRELFEMRHLAIGKKAPEISGLDQNGDALRLSDYRGKAVLLYFWTEY